MIRKIGRGATAPKLGKPHLKTLQDSVVFDIILNMNSNSQPAILYAGFDPRFALLRRRRLAGIRRCAKAHGWEVATLSPKEASPEAVRAAFARLHVVGCVVECWMAQYDLPPRLFGSLPVVYFNPPERRAWRGTASVACDEAAIAKAAFGELSASRPPCYAVATKVTTRHAPWARERVDAFRACCRKAGKPCIVFPERNGEGESPRLARLERWSAALPLHCAIFAVNDSTAVIVASALADAGRFLPRSATLVGADAAETPADGSPVSDISSVKIDYELSGYLAAKIVATSPSCPIRPSCPLPTPTYGPLLVERRLSTRGFGRREPWAQQAVDMIRREACDGLTAAKLARNFPVSRKLFELRFREAVGHSALNEILHVRMARVFDLLARPDFPIGAIADFCGFDSDRELRNLFRARTGTSMRDWRQAHR